VEAGQEEQKQQQQQKGVAAALRFAAGLRPPSFPLPLVGGVFSRALELEQMARAGVFFEAARRPLRELGLGHNEISWWCRTAASAVAGTQRATGEELVATAALFDDPGLAKNARRKLRGQRQELAALITTAGAPPQHHHHLRALFANLRQEHSPDALAERFDRHLLGMAPPDSSGWAAASVALRKRERDAHNDDNDDDVDEQQSQTTGPTTAKAGKTAPCGRRPHPHENAFQKTRASKPVVRRTEDADAAADDPDDDDELGDDEQHDGVCEDDEEMYEDGFCDEGETEGEMEVEMEGEMEDGEWE
jgi:hypothetical protein